MLCPPSADLLDRLDASRLRGYRLILITAPAGSGKTALLQQWLARRCTPSGSTPGAPRSAWLNLQPEDDQPASFWRDWLSALGALGLPLQEWAALAQAGASTLDLMDAMVGAINVLDKTFTGVSGGVILVLDNYHTIHAQAIHTAISLLLDHPPPAMQLVIATHTEPPPALGVPRLRARHQVLELGPAELATWQREG